MGKLIDSLRKKHAGDTTTPKRHGINFLAHKDEITEALKEGWAAKQIWAQLIEENMTTISYTHFCRLVNTHIMPSLDDADLSTTSNNSFVASEKLPIKQATKRANRPIKELTEKERLDLLKEEAFKSVRPAKPAGPLISKPKTREEENRELFGK